jgi:hypothetical protein
MGDSTLTSLISSPQEPQNTSSTLLWSLHAGQILSGIPQYLQNLDSSLMFLKHAGHLDVTLILFKGWSKKNKRVVNQLFFDST